MDLVFEVVTKTNSTYKLYVTKDEEMVILESNSKAFQDIDFIVLKSLEITKRLTFIGTVYSNAEIIENTIKKIDDEKELYKVDMSSEQSTTSISEMKVKDKNIFSKLVEKEIIKVEK